MIRDALLVAHRRAGHWRYLDALLAGNLTVDGFREMVVQRYFIYQAFEETADLVRADPIAAPFLFPELDRLVPIRRDLTFYYGPEWADKITPYDVTAEHCARIRRLATDWPAGYIAQHHVRYVGDLAGGQVFRDKMTEHTGLAGPGIEFYDFTEIPDVGRFRGRYHELLDKAPWDEEEQVRIADEAALAFDQTNALFTALADRTLGPA
nr:biliverdin-producing heme oxygenase [Micromonospora sp. DSM 115978]